MLASETKYNYQLKVYYNDYEGFDREEILSEGNFTTKKAISIGLISGVSILLLIILLLILLLLIYVFNYRKEFNKLREKDGDKEKTQSLKELREKYPVTKKDKEEPNSTWLDFLIPLWLIFDKLIDRKKEPKEEKVSDDKSSSKDSKDKDSKKESTKDTSKDKTESKTNKKEPSKTTSKTKKEESTTKKEPNKTSSPKNSSAKKSGASKKEPTKK